MQLGAEALYLGVTFGTSASCLTTPPSERRLKNDQERCLLPKPDTCPRMCIKGRVTVHNDSPAFWNVR